MHLPDYIKRIRLSAFQIIILGFLGVIFTGTLLLLLPLSQRAEPVPVVDALFTATSAVCVTGLVTKNTATFWSGFGQGVILCLIQIGGLGIATFGVAIAMVRQKKIGLGARIIMQTQISQNKVGGIIGMTLFILKLVFLIEFTGMVLLSFPFIHEFGTGKGLWFALFHSVSAFCNAGFDLLGSEVPFCSLTGYSDNGWITGVIMLLIISGGIGFLTWSDICLFKLRFRKYHLQTKIILSMTLALITVPAAIFFFTEFGDLPLHERIISSLFQAVTPRTAGFNTVDQAALSDNGRMLTICLMLTGGAPGSTAGGMKVTTLFVLGTLLAAVFGRSRKVHCFKRSITEDVLQNAATIFLMYLFLLLTGGMLISGWETVPLGDALFEAASALGTVGLTVGITPSLGTASKLLLAFYMFTGRVGGLTLIYALVFKKMDLRTGKFPMEDVAVG